MSKHDKYKKQYFYDEISGQYLYESNAYIDPMQSNIKGYQVYLLSANATFEMPLQSKQGYAVIWNGTSWQYMEDHRGLIVWKSYEQSLQIKQFGKIPQGYSIYRPQKPITVQDYDNALQQHIYQTRCDRGYTTRQPSYYQNSSVLRWRQDAKDWVSFLDSCMLYGLQVQNNYKQGKEVPTLLEFMQNLPKIVWTYQE